VSKFFQVFMPSPSFYAIKVTVDVYGHLVPGANRQAMNRLPVPKSATQPQLGKDETKETSAAFR
jgi:hypothetical protein